MRSAKDLMDELNVLDEGLHLEAKTSSQIGRAILESVCAFANKEGGFILCGVKRTEGQLFGYKTQGIKNPDKLICDIQSAAQTSFNVPIVVNSNRELLGTDCVVVVEVMAANDDVGLVYFSKDGLPKGAYERRGATDYRFRAEDMAAAIKRLSSMNGERLDGETMDALDAVQVRAYRDMRTAVRGESDDEIPEREFLEMLNFCTTKDGVTRPTRSGVVFLGAGLSLRKVVPGSKIYIARLPQREQCDSPGQDPLHQSYLYEGCAFEYTEKAISYVIGALPGSAHFSADSNTRDDLKNVRRRIAREVIVNAVAHRDFSALSNVEILHYSNRLEVRNPGTSNVPV